MSIKFSTGLREGLLASNSLRSLLNGGELRLYSGAVPISADAAIAPANTLLCTIRAEGAGLTFEAAAPNGMLTKNLAELWTGSVVAAGVATFYRHVLTADTGVASASLPRIQGEIALAGKDMSLSNPNLTLGAIQKIDYYSVTLLES